jgi:hypothetical protein
MGRVHKYKKSRDLLKPSLDISIYSGACPWGSFERKGRKAASELAALHTQHPAKAVSRPVDI